MKFVRFLAFFALSTTVIATSYAQTKPAVQSRAKPAILASATASSLTDAEVLNVYLKEKNVLLKHGPIPNIGMGAMTMEFSLPDTKILSLVKPGDKVLFAAQKVKSEYVVTHIELAK